ncbi:cytochrome P450 [Nonomuraea sp. NPDC050404]|uniref:cytochrome P450 n=1 Tax=Nonomuraea sp. NPDC050404 TaxID=3155783 RepID=UPI0033CBB1ED
MSPQIPHATPIPHATLPESLRFSLLYSLPMIVRGAFISRPAMARWLAALDTQARAQRFCMRLRVRYGGRSVYLRGPTGKALLVLAQDDVKRVLTAPEAEFMVATKEKRKGLATVQPDSLLLSRGELREDRRRFNEAILQPGKVPHDLGARVRQVVTEELRDVLGNGPDIVNWERLSVPYDRAVLRLLFGDAARDDLRILATIRALLGEANWLGLRPWRNGIVRSRRRVLTAEIDRYVAAAAEGSLMGLFAGAYQSERTCPAGQVPHWLLALGGIGAVLVTPALALLAGHPEHAARARAEADADGDGLEFLSACVSETARLWPLVPTLLRHVPSDTPWHGTRLPAGTSVMIPLSLHQRNPQIDHADAFTPDAWLDGRAAADWWIAPFSLGPGRCPGAELGTQVLATVLATLLRQYDFTPASPKLHPGAPLPKTLDSFSLRLRVRPRAEPAT